MRAVHDAAQQLAARVQASSAAAVGVGARRSATKSTMVKSVSWPTPLTTGMALAATSRASASSEAPEIFNAAAHQQQGIHFGALIGQPHLRGQPAGRVGALHRAG